MCEINDFECRILSFISAKGKSSVDDIKKAFPDMAAVELRIKGLKRTSSRPALITPLFTSKLDCGESVSVPTDVYELTPEGEKALQDHRQLRKAYTKELWLKNAWIPIIVSFITTVITHYILPKLASLIK